MKDVPRLSAWSSGVDAVLKSLIVEATRGLGETEAAARRARFGRNVLQAASKRHVLSILAAQFSGIVTALLLAASLLALAMSNVAEAIAIIVVIVVNASIGFFTEWRAVRSMEALRRFARISCVVLRDGMARSLPADDLVPGDIVLLEAGDMVPADLRLIEANKVNVDESSLTGESQPVDKQIHELPPETVLFERSNMAYKGTAVTRGSGRGVVTATGTHTEFGKIFEQVGKLHGSRTPLEQRLDTLGKTLAWVVIGIGLLLAAIGIMTGREALLAVEVAIALAVAAIPEGLPIVATIALAHGLRRMAAHNALITRLSAVETLGATNVILTDKTGTLTENRMIVTTVLLADGEVAIKDPGDDSRAGLLTAVLTTAALCNDASLQRDRNGVPTAIGSPTECALLEAAAAAGIWQEELLQRNPEVDEDPFDPDKKCMATVHAAGDRFTVAVKGAPEVVIGFCDKVCGADGVGPLDQRGREMWLERVEGLCERGLRAIAVAAKTADSPAARLYSGLALQGVFGIEDPPRAGIAEAIDRCRDAGVSIIMVTGDHAVTAQNIAASIGVINPVTDPERLLRGEQVDQLFAGERYEELLAGRVFARVTPEQKLKLIDLHQRQGQVVAMTGDGVNDAPALKKSDIGVAMGIRGTEVAREAAEMVLQDDELGTIVTAIGEGRAIFENIRKFVVYLISCNISEILVVTLATIAGAPLPLLPLQILFLNLVTDVFPALALGVGPGRPGLMHQRPRPSNEQILTRRYWMEIGLYGLVMAFATLGAMAFAIYGLGLEAQAAVTVAFCTLALAQLWHVFNMRGDIRRIWVNEITRNHWVWVALLLCIALVLMAIYLPDLNNVLQLTAPGAPGWAVIGVASVVPLVLAPAVRRIARRL
jgi:Ca2+-transporting ATPase